MQESGPGARRRKDFHRTRGALLELMPTAYAAACLPSRPERPPAPTTTAAAAAAGRRSLRSSEVRPRSRGRANDTLAAMVLERPTSALAQVWGRFGLSPFSLSFSLSLLILSVSHIHGTLNTSKVI